jgi:threonine dehydrogenase-like Zn-dependent dehydrogenase
MKAVAATPRTPGSARLCDVPDPPCGPGEVLVRVLECGVSPVDLDIDAGRAGEPAPGSEDLILGHESLGRVATTGRDVVGFVPGDLVVPTVRRPCGCNNCQASETDMCRTGRAVERGIRRGHGFLSEYFVEEPAYLVRVPRAVRPVAVLLAPLAAAEKAIFHAQAIQRRLRWQAERVLVVGAGPLGLLAAALARAQAASEVVVYSHVAADGMRGRFCRDLGATFVEAGSRPLESVGRFDLILEATGEPERFVQALSALGPNGVLSLLVRPPDGAQLALPSALLFEAVRSNQVVFGSSHAHRRDFERGAAHLAELEARWPGLLARLVTRRIPLERFREGFQRESEHLKTIVCLA